MKSLHSSLPSSLLLFLGLPLVLTGLAHAQAGISPEAAPGRDEAQSPAPTLTLPSTTPTPLPIVPAPDGAATTAPDGTALPPSSRLTAARVAYEGGTIIAQGDPNNPVVFLSPLGRVQANEIRLDTVALTVNATGAVTLERTVEEERHLLRSRRFTRIKGESERVTETAYGQNLTFNYKTQQGSLDQTVLRTSLLDFRAERLEINGQKYIARNAIIRPGGLTDEERRIYGTPPLSLHAREVTVRRDEKTNRTSLNARGAGLYFKNTRILPLPSALLQYGTGGNNQGFRIVPTAGYNSRDGLIVRAGFGIPLARNPKDLALNFNIGLSQRVGFRGGLTAASSQKWGDIRLAAQKSDIITTQLSNRIELDRKPEITYQSPSFGVFQIPKFGKSGFSVDAGYGRFTERSDQNSNPLGSVNSDRAQARLLFTTRLDPRTGPFLRAFASVARYSQADTHYNAAGVELGYGGRLLPRVNGEVSLRLTHLSGQTPFRFDLVEIPRELRTTFDISLTPRYIVPLDIRYDLDRSEVRDTTFGILRSYKVFAYGLVYQTARHDLRLEVRSGF